MTTLNFEIKEKADELYNSALSHVKTRYTKSPTFKMLIIKKIESAKLGFKDKVDNYKGDEKTLLNGVNNMNHLDIVNKYHNEAYNELYL